MLQISGTEISMECIYTRLLTNVLRSGLVHDLSTIEFVYEILPKNSLVYLPRNYIGYTKNKTIITMGFDKKYNGY